MVKDDKPVTWVRNFEIETELPIEGNTTGKNSYFFNMI